MTQMQDGPGLTDDERAELNRLRAENAALRAQGQAAPRPPRPGGRQRWRTIVAVLLIVLGCVLAPLAGVAVWARNQVTNSDRYVATITPLASDPAIQQAITDQITAQVFTAIDIQALTTQVVDALSARVEGRGLPPRPPRRCRGWPARSPTACRALSTPRSSGSSRARRSRTPGSRPTGSPTRRWSRP